MVVMWVEKAEKGREGIVLGSSVGGRLIRHSYTLVWSKQMESVFLIDAVQAIEESTIWASSWLVCILRAG